MKNDRARSADDGSSWDAGWEEHRKRQLTSALAASPVERLRWLEEMIAIAHRVGALPRQRDDRR